MMDDGVRRLRSLEDEEPRRPPVRARAVVGGAPLHRPRRPLPVPLGGGGGERRGRAAGRGGVPLPLAPGGVRPPAAQRAPPPRRRRVQQRARKRN
eukprot:gene14850-biopygen9191